MSRSPTIRRPGLALGLTLLLSACTGGDPAPEPTRQPQPRSGGEVILGAEQWPECINPITVCGFATWTHWAVIQHVFPRAMELDPQGNWVASPLLTQAPSLAEGGVTAGPPFEVTFQIDPKAVWDDGTPITSRDFRFTWRAIATGRRHYDPDDYKLIRAVDARDPHRVVITFDQIVVSWPELFGGPSGFILKKAAFPEHKGRNPDLSQQMLDNLPFSGGPFRLAEWSSTSAVLTRNERYFGKQALLDKVTLLPLITQAMELEALRVGQVAAIFPQMSFGGPSIAEAFGGEPRIQVSTGDGLYFEALWFNLGRGHVKDPRVREALMYAIDRQAVVDTIVKPYNPQAEVLNCGFVAFPHLGPWCETKPFSRFSYDPARSRDILESAGYGCSATYCAKDGRRLKVLYSTYANDVRRTATQELLAPKMNAAGFMVEIKNASGLGSGAIRRQTLAEYATGGYPDPSVTELFACDEIPNPKNDHYGQNYSHWCNREATLLMHESDQELNPDRRLEVLTRVHELQAYDLIGLPLYVLPVVSAWRTDKIAGPIGLYSSTHHGMFFNLNEWYVPA
jgi:peptide/nickel transport system substrate-binding protein